MDSKKNEFLTYIASTSDIIKDEVIKLIRDDNHWLDKLDITKEKLKNSISVADMIRIKLENPQNREIIDSILKYVINDYFIDDDELHLVKHEVSADSYGKKSAIYIFKCANEYFCYNIHDEIDLIITTDPIEFCQGLVESFEENYQMEVENLKDEYFKNSETTNSLHWNFNINKL